MLRLFCLSLAALALGLVPAATADSNGPKSSSQDFATGSAKFTAVDAHVIVDAHSGPAGEDPQGHFALDQGPVILMIENYRSGLIWRLMRSCPFVVRGLKRAGFTGGWLGT